MKKIINIFFVIFLLMALTGCEEQMLTSEEQDNYDELRNAYIGNMLMPDPTISSYSMEFSFYADDFDYETLKKIDAIQMWLDDLENVEIVEMVFDNETASFDFMLRETAVEHRYKIAVSTSTNNFKYYVSSVKIPSTTESSGFYIVIYDEIDLRQQNGMTPMTEGKESVISSVKDDENESQNSVENIDNIM